MDADLRTYKLDPRQGEALWFFGGLATVKASAEQTGGRFSISEQMFPGGMATPLHSQPDDDETFYVLEGELTFFLAENPPFRAAVGAFVHIPKGVAYVFRVDSETARYLDLTTTQHEHFMRAAGELARGLCRRGGRPPWRRSWPRRNSMASKSSVRHRARTAEDGDASPGDPV